MVFHIELRRFPYTARRFNLGEPELLGQVLDPWLREGWIKMDERDWNAHEAKLTILEGPEIEVAQISLGRGWKTAQRQGRDVTAQMRARAELKSSQPGPPAEAAARADAGASPKVATPPARAPGERGPGGAEERRMLADSLALELLNGLGEEGFALSVAWSRAGARLDGAAPSDSLALAEEAVRSLLGTQMVALSSSYGQNGAAAAEAAGESAPDSDALLRAAESWSGDGAAARAWLRRA